MPCREQKAFVFYRETPAAGAVLLILREPPDAAETGAGRGKIHGDAVRSAVKTAAACARVSPAVPVRRLLQEER